MDIPKGERVCCAADLFEYDENKALNLRKFFAFYKDQFPMLIVIIGGHYGETKFDCYDNLQVLRVHCITSQPRAVAEDSRTNPAARVGYVTIPEDTSIKFRVVKSHTRVGNPQKLKEILKEHDTLPLMLQFACDPQYPVRVGTSRHVARNFGNIFIRERYMEHFFIMNSVDGVELNMNKLTCMACLSEDLEATPVTGYKYKSKADFDELLRKLAKDVEENGQEYDRSSGNNDFSEYSFDDMRHLLEISVYKTGTLTDTTETVDANEEDDEYEEFPPLLPARDLPKQEASERSDQKTKHDNKDQSKPLISHKPKQPKSPKTPETDKPSKGTDKPSKGGFGLFKRKHHAEHDAADGATKQSTGETDRPKPSAPKTQSAAKTERPKPSAHKTQSAAETERTKPSAHKTHSANPTSRTTFPEVPPHIPTKPASQNQSHSSNVDTNSGYVTLLGHSGYQNTKIGRATIKPMPRANVSKQDSDDDLQKQAAEEDEQGNYEVLDNVHTTIFDKHSAVQSVAPNTHTTLLNELQQTTTGDDNYEQDTLYEEYEDMDIGKYRKQENSGYMVPKSTTSESSHPAYKDKENNSHSIVNQSHNRQEVQSDVKQEQGSEDISVFSARTLSIKDVGDKLTELKLGKYVEDFVENQIDGEILASLSVDDFVKELGLKKLEAVRLHKFATSGHIPK